jgi:hypothetical protein
LVPSDEEAMEFQSRDPATVRSVHPAKTDDEKRIKVKKRKTRESRVRRLIWLDGEGLCLIVCHYKLYYWVRLLEIKGFKALDLISFDFCGTLLGFVFFPLYKSS